MTASRIVVVAALGGLVAVGAACSDRAVEDTKAAPAAAIEATKSGAEKAVDATKKAGTEALEVTKDVAGDVADKSKEMASATGAAVTDTWITGKVKAKFVDEKILDGSSISVETKDHVVTLTGTVASAAAKARAAEIARGTENVASVVDRIVVKSKS